MYKIDKCVPLVNSLRGGRGISRHSKYPFKTMQPGDSFFVLLKDTNTNCLAKLQGRIRSSMDKYKQYNCKPSWVFVTRQIDNVGVRCWRVE